MRASQLVSDFFEWRWAPCVGLTAGSLAFVALALLLIPTQFEGGPSEEPLRSSLDRPSSPQPTRSLFGASLTSEAASLGRRASRDREAARPALPSEPPAAPQRGFSPVVEREAYVPPAAPEPPPAPTPAPGSVIIQQPEPGGPSREVTVQ